MVKQYNQMISDYVRNDGSRQIIVGGKTNEEQFICTAFTVQTSPQPFIIVNKEELTDRMRYDAKKILDSGINAKVLNSEPDMNNNNKMPSGPNVWPYKTGLDSSKIPVYGLVETLLNDPNKKESYADIMLTPKIIYDDGIFVG